MIRGIHPMAISTADLERSVRFYRDLLGFEEIFTSDGNEVLIERTRLPASRIRRPGW